MKGEGYWVGDFLEEVDLRRLVAMITPRGVVGIATDSGVVMKGRRLEEEIILPSQVSGVHAITRHRTCCR